MQIINFPTKDNRGLTIHRSDQYIDSVKVLFIGWTVITLYIELILMSKSSTPAHPLHILYRCPKNLFTMQYIHQINYGCIVVKDKSQTLVGVHGFFVHWQKLC